MRVIALTLIFLTAIACSGDSAPVETATVPESSAPTEATAPGSDADDDTRTIGIVGGSRVGVYIPPDWERVDRFTQQFYDGQLEALIEEFSPELKIEMPLQELRAFRQRVLDDYGSEIEVVATMKEEKEGYSAYKRAARFTADERLIEIAWVLDAENRIAALVVTPDLSGD